MLKILKYIVLFLITLLLALVVVIITVYETSIDKVMTKERQEWFINSINNSPDLPDKLYKTLHKYYPNRFSNSVWSSLLYGVLFNKKHKCEYLSLYYYPVMDKHSKLRFQHIIVALEIEENCSQKKCFDYRMSTSRYGSGIRGIHQASLKFYNKELSKLNEREILSLIIIPIAPSWYSPRRNPERLKRVINEIMEKAKK